MIVTVVWQEFLFDFSSFGTGYDNATLIDLETGKRLLKTGDSALDAESGFPADIDEAALYGPDRYLALPDKRCLHRYLESEFVAEALPCD